MMVSNSPDFEGITKFRNTDSGGIEKVIGLRCDADRLYTNDEGKSGQERTSSHTQAWTAEFLLAKKQRLK